MAGLLGPVSSLSTQPLELRSLADRVEGYLQATKLCEYCLQIFDPSLPRMPLGMRLPQKSIRPVICHEHHTSYESLVRSVEAGCRVCIHLHDQWARTSRVLRQDESFFFDRRDHHFTLGVMESGGDQCTVLGLVDIKNRKITG